MKKLIFLFACLIFTSVHYAQNLSLLGHKTYPNGVSCSNLTGYAANGKEYALVGTSLGLSIVDITIPTNPTEIFAIPGATGQGGFWREVREHNGYAYVTTEQNSGLLVVNLTNLPNSAPYQTVNPGGLVTSHTVFIASDGYAYINGTDLGQEGSTVILDLNANPWNPPVVGQFQTNYIHDCFERNDTLWAACINDGFIKVVNVSNKTQADLPQNTLAVWNTPQNFAHNCWPSDDGRYLFTTDEKPSSWLTCYDVSDLSNVTEVSRIQAEPGDSTIIHNTYFLNDYCITSYYTYGVTIHDVSRKNNMVETGHFDTSPGFQGDGFNGCWGVWPYLPSGNIIASDIETGLWILSPTYTRASFLEGTVRDSACNLSLNGVTVTINGGGTPVQTGLTGAFATGAAAPGLYSVTFSKPGYQSLTIPGIQLTTGQVTTLNINLQPANTTDVLFRILESGTNSPVAGANLMLKDNNGIIAYEGTTNASGEYRICNLEQANYELYYGKWSYRTEYTSINLSGNPGNVILPISKGYYDDFTLDFGWTTAQTASAGWWQRNVPVGTEFNGIPSNIGFDVPNDFSNTCFVTGNAGGQAGEDDVDNGSVTLTSPAFDLSGTIDPYVQLYTSFFNGGGNGPAANDTLWIRITNGTDTATLDRFHVNNTLMSQWIFHQYPLVNYIAPTAQMRLLITAADLNPGHLVEAAVDKFEAFDSAAVRITENNITPLTIFPNPTNDQFTLLLDETAELSGMIQLTDLQGRLIDQLEVTERTIRFGTQLQPGIYLCSWIKNHVQAGKQRIVKLR